MQLLLRARPFYLVNVYQLLFTMYERYYHPKLFIQQR
jgi:hypothetical protein